MAALSFEQKLLVISALVQGNSISATVKMTRIAKTTIMRLLQRVGAACDRLHDKLVRDLRCLFVELDEQWSFIGKKEKRVTATDRPDAGDVFTYTAFDRNSRLSSPTASASASSRSQTPSCAICAGAFSWCRRSRWTASGLPASDREVL